MMNTDNRLLTRESSEQASTIQYVVNGVTANSLVFTLKKLCV